MARIEAGGEEGVIDGDGVVEGGGERVLGGEPVLGDDGLDPAGEGEAADERAMRGEGAHHEAAAVNVEEGVLGAVAGVDQPLAREAGELARVDLEADRELGARAHRVEDLALLGERHLAAEGRGDLLDEGHSELISDLAVHR